MPWPVTGLKRENSKIDDPASARAALIAERI
jgi:hypothetical protein